MTPAATRWPGTGLLGPVSFYAVAALLALSPLVRGGNRSFALVPLELLALAALAPLAVRLRPDDLKHGPLRALLLLAAAPLALGVVQLLPVLPTSLWLHLPGRGEYGPVIDLAGGATDWRALSVAPRATAAALLAGLPLAAALLAGHFATLDQLRALFKIVVAVALLQAVLAAMQLGGDKGFLMFGAHSGAPVGTFGNRNHYGSYMAMALGCWMWLAWGQRRDDTAGANLLVPFAWDRNGVKIALALVLVLALVVSRSRAAVLVGVAAALIALALARALRRDPGPLARWVSGGIFAAATAVVLVIAADAFTQRLVAEDLGEAAGFRAELARTSLQAAAAFFPFGSGWGTYDLVYPRFQPEIVAKFVNHAHMDFIEMLVEGGIFFLALASLFAWLAARRARVLWRIFAHGHRASQDAVCSAFCGAALLVPLLHSLVEFNLRIPALAIVASLLAGSYLRPLPGAPARP